MTKKYKNGFTLIEISIILVILGLIVGGVLVGKDLIRNAKIHQVISDINQFNTAINTFQEKFDFLPGDMPNAYEYFDSSGTNTICGSNNADLAGCNGNGNGIIEGVSSTYGEYIRALLHLSLANIIPQQNYVFAITRRNRSDVENAPFNTIAMPTQLKNVGIAFTVINTSENYFAIGKYISLSEPKLRGSFLSSTEAYSVDTKTDDAQPDTGKIRGRNGDGMTTDCINSGINPSSYNISSKTISCYLTVQIN